MLALLTKQFWEMGPLWLSFVCCGKIYVSCSFFFFFYCFFAPSFPPTHPISSLHCSSLPFVCVPLCYPLGFFVWHWFESDPISEFGPPWSGASSIFLESRLFLTFFSIFGGRGGCGYNEYGELICKYVGSGFFVWWLPMPYDLRSFLPWWIIHS